MTGAGVAPGTLRVSRLSKAYGRQPVLDGIDLIAPGGTITAVTGSNGCGKSTLLRCIAGLARHDGTVTYRDQPIEAMRPQVGYLPQSVGLPSWASIGEVLAFFARLRGADPASLPLPDGFLPHADRQVGVLSGGQRQRVALAVVMLGSPSLLLLDEPSANLDDTSRSTLWRTLQAAAETGTTIVVATPVGTDLDSLERNVVEIVDGRLRSGGAEPSQCLHNGKAPTTLPAGVQP